MDALLSTGPDDKGSRHLTAHRHPARADEPPRRRPLAGPLPPVGLDPPYPIAALLAIAAAVLAAGDATSASVGPGRFVLLAVVIAWCVGALVTSVLRPGEPLAA